MYFIRPDTHNDTFTSLERVPTNCGRDNYLPCRIAVWLWKCLPITLVILGTIGNGLNFVVLTRQRIRKYTTSIFLLALALSDFLYLWTTIIRYVILVYEYIDTKEFLTFICKLHDWASLTTAGVSNWLIVLMTIERITVIKWPILAKTKLTHKVVWMTVIILLVCVSLLCSPNFFIFEIEEVRIDSETVKMCHYVSTLAKTIDTVTWSYLAFNVSLVVPAICIVVGNTIIVVALKKQNKCMQSGLCSNQAGSTPRSKRQNAANKMLFAISGFCLLTNIPRWIFLLVLTVAFKQPTPHSFATLQLCYAVTLILYFCNYTFNFYLYCISGSIFKEEWNTVVGEVKQKVISTCSACRKLDR